MDNEFSIRIAIFVSAALGVGLAVPAFAQSAATAPRAAAAENTEVEEIIVTARRKNESLQDVPTTINAVTGAEIEKLNIRKFEDIAGTVPGLAMATTPNGVVATASVRGVNYDVNASGNNGTIEFYLNDAPISAGNLFQTVYDIQQVELLRGPQGTLRGRASPSGSMTVTTRRPDFNEFGGYVSGTGTDIGGYNGQGAVSIPVIDDKLAVRVAGAYDKNEYNRVHSLNNPTDPDSKSKSGRVTVRFEPMDTLSFIATAQKTNQKSTYFDLMESQQVVYPNNPVIPRVISPPLVSNGVTFIPAVNDPTPPPFINARSRLTVTDTPHVLDLDYKNYNLQAQWAFAGQKLNYVGARNEQHLYGVTSVDIGDYFGPLASPVYQQVGQTATADTRAKATAHELRLSNEERIAGMFDYVVGAFTQKVNTPTNLLSITPLATPAPALSVNPVQRLGGNTEKSGFANLTAHIGDALELSAGARYIEYSAHGSLLVGGVRNPAADQDSSWNTTIYSGSVKYNFTEDFMAYATVGTAWRPGISVIGDFSLSRSALENSFLVESPEKSTSYEVGFKSSALDKRIRTNVSFFHQKFTDYPYRSPGGVWYIETFLNRSAANPAGVLALRPSIFNFVAAVPAEVNGAEAEVNFSAAPDWDMSVSAAVSKGKIKGGFIPCNDFNKDGIPDVPGPNPSLATLQNAVGGVGTPATQSSIGTISGCNVTQSSSSAPQWSAVLQSEYRLPINASLSSFLRGQATLYGNSKNDPLNPVDDVNNYALINLFLGVRDPNGKWEAALYGKNVTNTWRALSRAGSVATTALNSDRQPTNYLGSDNTGGMVVTAPREFGLNLRYNFGSK